MENKQYDDIQLEVIRFNSGHALVLGAPGCGKTVFAEKFAEETNFNFLMIKASDLGSSFVHGSQEKISKLFKLAEKNAPIVLCFDEFDALVPGPEGMYIRAFGDETIVCAGSSKHVNECERGTVYAVYELLERYLGCSLTAYVNPDIAGGEYIPSLDGVISKIPIL